MARLATGGYKVEYYDGYGSKLRLLTETATSIGDSHAKAEITLKSTQEDGDLSTAKTYTIDRRLFNSLG